MAFKGMDPDQGREVGEAISNGGTTLVEIFEEVTNLVTSVEWVGPDADTYKGDWNSLISSKVSTLVDTLNAKGSDLSQQAEEQDTTSTN